MRLTRRPGLTVAEVLVDQVHALAPVLAGVAVTLVHLVLAAVARVARLADTREAGDAVHAGAVVARVRITVITVPLANGALETWRGRVQINQASKQTSKQEMLQEEKTKACTQTFQLVAFSVSYNCTLVFSFAILRYFKPKKLRKNSDTQCLRSLTLACSGCSRVGILLNIF